MRGADLLVRSLAVAGVQRLFTLSGNQIMSVFDATLDEGLDLLHVRHEAPAVHMADAFGRLTGEPGVALVTAGPGFANALSALYVALMAESPLVLISGASATARAGQGAFQEMPQAEMAGHVTKASWQIDEPDRIGHDVARALRTAKSGRPGPVHVSIPGDVLAGTVKRPPHAMPNADDFLPIVTPLDAQSAESVTAALHAAKRPVVLAGPAMTRGDGPAALRRFTDATNVPTVPMGSPRGLKDPSLGRFREVLPAADVVLLLGRPVNFAMAFGESPAFNSECRFLVLDTDMRMLELAGRNVGDARLPVTALADPLPAVERLRSPAFLKSRASTRDETWYREVQAAIAFRPPDWATRQSPERGPLHPAELCRVVRSFLADDDEAVFVSDGGEFGQWAQACIAAPHRVINGPSGAIGSGISFALAARVACPESRVVATVGDGTFGFHPLEIETAIRHNLPVVVIVGNDARWNAEYQIQLRDYGPERLVGCELLPTRYDEVVAALGGHGEFVTRPDELEPALRWAFDSGKPACVNVMIEGVAAPE
ncbi:MAG: thiamine pyrophosphate-binding protein [Planctomycetaceae bacterium]